MMYMYFVLQLIYVYVSPPQLDIKLMCKGSVYFPFVIPEKRSNVHKVLVIPRILTFGKLLQCQVHESVM